ncbi:RNAse P Rpr2/Rpp21/SNM1 subunit domain-containing protein [Truncatella angustata]|uniref:RNAse P Rpr2/Rpp21/SNM1 subunit domain-containing protein n=1 Tax=Truncatella angustata TaxID=152316 RepID=A0A9P8UD34_9PEZI|nr:RNAse P Rpr2/Rpp21/SNM1 subunit domain-containing protein [Truncatella angustata]KAH6647060.1 RNAse P Rpr2/Rpp21/SNM1 subunit domain-containing protein [Truncatella angustata]
MGKVKQPGSVPNRHIYSRISYLYQAASYLASTNTPLDQAESQNSHDNVEHVQNDPNRQQSPTKDTHKQAMSRRLLNEMRATSLKTQIRISPAVKHTVCKYCDSLLIEGETCNSIIENKSKGGKKPWADIMVITCNTCGRLARFPAQASRQKRRPAREQLQRVQALKDS